jgi:hypothetical protein
LFGAKDIRFDGNTGYDTFTLFVSTGKGDITLERKLNKTSIRVSSRRPDIESGECTAKWQKGSKKDDISDVWLRLMGIAENHEIIKNSRRDKVRLTLRLFSHIFLVKEELVLQEKSLISPVQNTVEPAAFSALYFLVTGEDFSDTTPKEEKRIREARKKAVIDYMNSRLAMFADKKAALAELPASDPGELQTEVELVVEELGEIDRQIAVAIGRSKALMQQAYELSGELSECNTLDAHFKDLQSQYTADIRRAELIVDGEAHRHGIEDNDTCPYCESKMPPRKVKSHAASTKGSIETTKGLLLDLIIAQADLETKRTDIVQKIKMLENEKSGVDNLLASQLRPKAETLKRMLEDYRLAIEIRKEVSVFDTLENDLKDAIDRKSVV